MTDRASRSPPYRLFVLWRVNTDMRYNPGMAASSLQFAPLGPYIGARVDGIDLSEQIDDDSAAMLEKALADQLMLVFPK